MLAVRDHKEGEEVSTTKKVGRTYTPMTDCFFGASVVMIATGDLLI